MKTIHKTISLLLAALLLFSCVPLNAFAEDYPAAARFSDWPDDWSAEALQTAVDNGLMEGSGGKIHPKDSLKRAEMAAIINRAFGATEMDSLEGFTDVPVGAWYRDDMAKALKMGTFKGGGNALLMPENPIKREEAFAVINRAFQLEEADSSVLDRFGDKDQISLWAVPELAAMYAQGYIQGDGKNLNPQGYISRAEFAQVMHNIVKTYITKPGVITEIVKGNALINVPGVTLENLTVEGDLIIGDGVGTGTVTLIGVTVTGRIVNRSGADIVRKDATATTSNTGGSGGEGNKVTVTFETNGGSEVLPLTLNKGELLSSIPMPSMEGYAFTGWFTESSLSDPFYSDDPIVKSMTLYARYGERDNNVQDYTDPNKYIEDCDANFAVTVLSPEVLTTANLVNYIDMTLESPGDTPSVTVSGSGGKYTITPVQPYQAGRLYKLVLKDDNLFFDGEDEGVRELSFRIHREESEIIEFREGVIDIAFGDFTNLGEGFYTLPADEYSDIKAAFDQYMIDNQNKVNPDDPEKSVILRFNNTMDENGDVDYRKVISCNQVASGDLDPDLLLLQTDSCQPGEIYDKVNVYGEELLDPGVLLEAAMKIDTVQVALDAKNSEGAAQMQSMLINALSQSPTIQALADSSDELAVQNSAAELPTGYTYFTTPSEGATKVNLNCNFIDVTGVDVTCTIGGTDNANFMRANPALYMTKAEWAAKYPELADEYPNIWPVLTLKFEYTIVIKNKVKVDVVFEAKEFLTASIQGWCEYNGDLLDPTTWGDLTFDYMLNVYSQTDLLMKVLATTIDIDDDMPIDITREIEKLIDDDEDSSDPAVIMEKVLDGKGDYLDIVEQEIVNQTVSIAKIIDIDFELHFVVRLNFAAGISSKISYMCAQQFGITGSLTDKKVSTYKNVLPGNGGVQFDLYAAGYLGVKVGLRGGVFVSVVGLKDIGRAGVNLEVGAYADIYGFFHLNVTKPNGYIYDSVRGFWVKYEDESVLSTQIALEGAVYMETGVYVEMEFVIESKVLSAKLSIPMFEYKFPLFSMGDRYVLCEFENLNDKIVMTGATTLPLGETGGLLEAKYIDIMTSKTVTGYYTSLDRFAIQFSSDAFMIRENAIIVDKDEVGTRTRADDTAVSVFYLGSSFTFGNKTKSVDLSGYQEQKTIIPKVVDDILLTLERTVTNSKGEVVAIVNVTREAKLELLFKESTLDAVHKAGFITRNGEVFPSNGQYGADFVPLTVDEYKALMTRYVDGELAYELDYNKFNKTTTQVKLIWLTWIDSNTFIGTELEKIYTPVKATYLLDINGTRTVLGEKNLLPGTKPGAPDCGGAWLWNEWIENTYSVVITDYTDFNEPIIEDTEYIINAAKPQKAVSFITLRDGQWHLDVYAVNVGDVPTPPTGYGSGTGTVFDGWEGISGSYDQRYPKYKLEEVVIGRPDNILYGLDTTPPLYSTSGTWEDCSNAYYKTREPDGLSDAAYSYYYLSQYLYIAQYDLLSYTITVNFPTLNYYDGNHIIMPLESQVQYGDTYIPPYWQYYFRDGSGYEYLGLDADGDGTADYGPGYDWDKNPLLVTGDMTLNVLYKVKTNSITVLDYAGNTVDTFAVNYGNKPLVVYTEPVHPDNNYTFYYWEVSKNGGAYRRITASDYWAWEMGFFADDSGIASFTLKPVYRQDTSEYYVCFRTGEDPTNIHLYLPKGTYNVSDFTELTSPNPIPRKSSDNVNDYIWSGWECGDTFTVTGEDELEIAAVFTATPKVYTVTINTGGGKFADGTTADKVYTGGYGQSTNIGTIDTPTKDSTAQYTYTFSGWSNAIPTIFTQNITITAQYTETPRGYTITFDAGEGGTIDSAGAQTSSSQALYGSTIILPGAADITKPADDDNTYTLTAWKDMSNIKYEPGAEYTVTGDMTFTAEFEAVPKPEPVYSVQIFAWPGTFSDGETVREFTGTAGTEIDFDWDNDLPTRSGYTFECWEDADGTKIDLADLPGTVTKNIAIFASWTQSGETFTVTYNANGGTGSHSVPNIAVGSSHTVLDMSSAGISNSGYAFTGWNTQSGGGGASYSPGMGIIINGNTTLYAQWEITGESYTFTGDRVSNFSTGSILELTGSGDAPAGNYTMESAALVTALMTANTIANNPQYITFTIVREDNGGEKTPWRVTRIDVEVDNDGDNEKIIKLSGNFEITPLYVTYSGTGYYGDFRLTGKVGVVNISGGACVFGIDGGTTDDIFAVSNFNVSVGVSSGGTVGDISITSDESTTIGINKGTAGNISLVVNGKNATVTIDDATVGNITTKTDGTSRITIYGVTANDISTKYMNYSEDSQSYVTINDSEVSDISVETRYIGSIAISKGKAENITVKDTGSKVTVSIDDSECGLIDLLDISNPLLNVEFKGVVDVEGVQIKSTAYFALDEIESGSSAIPIVSTSNSVINITTNRVAGESSGSYTINTELLAPAQGTGAGVTVVSGNGTWTFNPSTTPPQIVIRPGDSSEVMLTITPPSTP